MTKYLHTPTNREFTHVGNVTDKDGTTAMLLTHSYTDDRGKKCVSRAKCYPFMLESIQQFDRHGNSKTLKPEYVEVSE